MAARIRWISIGMVILVAATSLADDAARQVESAAKAARALEIIQSDTPAEDKAIPCKILAIYGGPEAVPALAALLPDPELCSWARIALESIPGPEADKALRNALGKVQGRQLIGVVNSLGVRRDAKAVDALADLMKQKDIEVASAAACALGHIGGEPAAQALESYLAAAPDAVRPAVAEGCILCAEKAATEGNSAGALRLYDLVRKADVPPQRILEATRGAILVRKGDGVPLLVEQLRSADKDTFHLGLTVARELPHKEVGEALAAELARAPVERQPLLLTVLADRGDPAGLPAILEAARQGPKEMRVVAIRAIKKMQVASAAPALLDAATAEGAVGSAALDTLAALKGSDVDREIVERLEKAEGNSRAVLMRLAGQRRIADAVPVLEKALDDPDKEIRAAALFALGQTIVPADLPKLIAVAMSPTRKEDAEAAVAALRSAATRMPDREATAQRLNAEMATAPIDGKIMVLEILTDMGGPRALAAVAAATRSDSPELQDAGTRLLGQWMSPDAAEVTLDLARTLKNEKYRNRVMKGCIRILRQFEMPDEKRIALSAEAIKASRLPEEEILICEVLRRTPTKATLDLAVSLLSDPETEDVAAKTAVEIAASVIEDDPKAVTDAMEKLLAANPRNGKVRSAAQSMLKRISEGKTR